LCDRAGSVSSRRRARPRTRGPRRRAQRVPRVASLVARRSDPHCRSRLKEGAGCRAHRQTRPGSTDSLRVSIPGSGDLRADGLTARDAAVTIDGSGKALVNATGTLDASIAGSGSIAYLGDPEVSRRIDGSGEIREA